MIAMQYKIALPDHYDMNLIRKRICMGNIRRNRADYGHQERADASWHQYSMAGGDRRAASDSGDCNADDNPKTGQMRGGGL